MLIPRDRYHAHVVGITFHPRACDTMKHLAEQTPIWYMVVKSTVSKNGSTSPIMYQ